MGYRAMILGAALTVTALACAAAAWAEAPAPVGSVVAVTGSAEVGRDGLWQPAAAKTALYEGQTIRTSEASGVEILFEGGLPASVGAKIEIAVADLLLKAQLEKARGKISAPTDDAKAEMKVTPLTGVRGTEKAEEKAGDLKREHYWNESAPAAK